MTIVTKPLSEKKGEKPLVEGVKVDILPQRTPSHEVPLVHAGTFRALVTEKRVNSASTACLFLTALVVMSCGVVTGLYLYREFVRAQMDKFHLRCNIPYALQQNADQDLPSLENDMMMSPADSSNTIEDRFFQEEFEIEGNYEKISVPDFTNGRQSKFIHDFQTNKTGIVDVEGRRCFVMPLNRTLVIPPEDLIDLVTRMQQGYYEVDVGYIREKMRAVTPAIENRASLGRYIEKECFMYPIYRLERIDRDVEKRSADPEINFVEFAGKNTQVLHIVNYKELQEHEELMPVAMA